MLERRLQKKLKGDYKVCKKTTKYLKGAYKSLKEDYKILKKTTKF